MYTFLQEKNKAKDSLTWEQGGKQMRMGGESGL